jgi:hypothetical protein
MHARHGLRELHFQTLRCERESCGWWKKQQLLQLQVAKLQTQS